MRREETWWWWCQFRRQPDRPSLISFQRPSSRSIKILLLAPSSSRYSAVSLGCYRHWPNRISGPNCVHATRWVGQDHVVCVCVSFCLSQSDAGPNARSTRIVGEGVSDCETSEIPSRPFFFVSFALHEWAEVPKVSRRLIGL